MQVGVLVRVVLALSRSSFSLKSICLVRFEPLQKNRRTDLFGKCWPLNDGFRRRIVVFPIISDDIGGEITRLRPVGVSNVGSGGASCPRRSAKTAIPGAVPVVFRWRFLVTQIILDDSASTFSLCQIRFPVRCVVHNHNNTTSSANKCCRKVKLSVNR